MAEKIRVVLDNLNTHRPASLYETFDPAAAWRILKGLEFHYTPKHGSWLNKAEIELKRGTSGPCLIRKANPLIGLDAHTRTGNPGEDAADDAHATIAWRFSTSAARTTLRHL